MQAALLASIPATRCVTRTGASRAGGLPRTSAEGDEAEQETEEIRGDTGGSRSVSGAVY